MSDDAKEVTLSLEVARHLFDLATDDIRVLRKFAIAIGVDPLGATPFEFIRDFPHAFQPFDVDKARCRKPSNWSYSSPLGLWETDDEVIARATRIGADLTQCIAGGPFGSRKCRRDASDPIHQAGAPEPTSDGLEMVDE
jgi:hypothetical protein